MHRTRLALLAIVLTASSPALAASGEDAAIGPFRLGLGLGGSYGSLDGFVQIPRGGAEGTTSIRRPTMDELGIDRSPSLELEATAEWGAHGLSVRGVLLHPEATTRLDAELVSNDARYEAGTRLRSSLRLDTYELAYRHRFELELPLVGRLDLLPSIGGGLYDFGMDLSDGDGHRSDRSFAHLFPQLGLGIEASPVDGLRVRASAAGIPRLVADTENVNAELRVAYRILGDRDGPALELSTGIAYRWLDFEDSQPTPNHTRIEHGPVVGLGIALEL